MCISPNAMQKYGFFFFQPNFEGENLAVARIFSTKRRILHTKQICLNYRWPNYRLRTAGKFSAHRRIIVCASRIKAEALQLP
jgi:hypothetical protein